MALDFAKTAGETYAAGPSKFSNPRKTIRDTTAYGVQATRVQTIITLVIIVTLISARAVQLRPLSLGH